MKRYKSSKEYEPEVLKHLHEVQVEILKDFIRTCDKHNLKYFAVYGTALGAVRHQGFIPWDDDIDVGMLREDYYRFFEVFEEELGQKYTLLTPEIDERYACTVTHIQKKGTKFISEDSQDLKCERGIFMDIFPYDYIADSSNAQRKQELATFFWGKLLFLSGTAYPYIPIEGIVGRLAGMVCIVVHGVLKLLNVSPRTLYRRYLKNARSYNAKGSKKYITSFENPGAVKNKICEDDMYPLQKVKFETTEIYIPANNHEIMTSIYGDYMQLPPEDKRVNHRPLVIDFGDN